MANLQGPHLIIILLVILLLFGAAKLPALAKSLGQSARVFKGEMKAMKDEDEPAAGTASKDSAPESGTVANTSTDGAAPESPTAKS